MDITDLKVWAHPVYTKSLLKRQSKNLSDLILIVRLVLPVSDLIYASPKMLRPI